MPGWAGSSPETGGSGLRRELMSGQKLRIDGKPASWGRMSMSFMVPVHSVEDGDTKIRDDLGPRGACRLVERQTNALITVT